MLLVGLPATGIRPFATMSIFQAGAIALITVYGAYVAEVFRAGTRRYRQHSQIMGAGAFSEQTKRGSTGS